MINRSHYKDKVIEGIIKEAEELGFSYNDDDFTLNKSGVKFSPEMAADLRHFSGIEPFPEFEALIKYETEQRNQLASELIENNMEDLVEALS